MKSEYLIAALIFLIIGIITFWFVINQKKQIVKYLKNKSAKNIVISWMPIDFDRDNHTYWVEYEDSFGKKHNTTCKINTWGSSIYWEEEN
jgi:hypothetical protein